MNCSGNSTSETPIVTTTASEPLAMAIVRAVAAVENEEPQALRPLGDVVDPQALEAVVESESDLHVTFSYCGYQVVVTDAQIQVYS
jgi:hypothetical protein